MPNGIEVAVVVTFVVVPFAVEVPAFKPETVKVSVVATAAVICTEGKMATRVSPDWFNVPPKRMIYELVAAGLVIFPFETVVVTTVPAGIGVLPAQSVKVSELVDVADICILLAAHVLVV